jgi:drug/metabolite transporter (DMT)-like permease
MNMTSRRNGVMLCLIATLFWGGMFPIMDSALRHIDAFSFTCLRYLSAGVLFVITLAVVEGRKSFDLRGQKVLLAWMFGTAGFTGFQFLVFYGQHLVGKGGALVASIIMATMPMQAFFVNWFLKKVAPPKFVLVFIGISLVGIVLVLTKGNLSTLAHGNKIGPMLLILFAAFCWVVYTSGASYFPQWSPIRYTAITTVLGLSTTLVVTAVLYVSGAVKVPTGGAVGDILPHLAYMSVLAGFVAVLAWNYGNRILTPLNGTLFMDVVPITTFIIASMTGDVPRPVQIVGALMTAGCLIVNNMLLRSAGKAIAAPAAAAPAAAPAAAAPAELVLNEPQ